MSYSPYADVSFVGVFHDDPVRVERLLDHVRPWFTNLVIGVQTDAPSDDATLAVVRGVADDVLVEPVAGFAEPTLNRLLDRVTTEWSFVISADERPDVRLLDAIADMTYLADHGDDYSTLDGFWIRFVSSIDGIDYPTEQDNHLRLFRTRLGWPATMHSRPPAMNAAFWPAAQGIVRHERSLDEMCRDYLRYLSLSRDDEGWIAHNRLMLHDACAATASAKGWTYVRAFEWFPAVEAVAFDRCTETCTAGGGYDCRGA